MKTILNLIVLTIASFPQFKTAFGASVAEMSPLPPNSKLPLSVCGHEVILNAPISYTSIELEIKDEVVFLTFRNEKSENMHIIKLNCSVSSASPNELN
jgi:hypothetical protein